MVPGRLTYYESNDMRVRKGEIVLERSSNMEGLPDYKGILSKKLSHRFKVATHHGALEIELCAESPAEKAVSHCSTPLFTCQTDVFTEIHTHNALL